MWGLFGKVIRHLNARIYGYICTTIYKRLIFYVLIPLGRYHFNKEAGTCEQFYYGGCGGNKNNFKKERSCRSRCSVDFSIPVIEDFRLEFCFLSKGVGVR